MLKRGYYNVGFIDPTVINQKILRDHLDKKKMTKENAQPFFYITKHMQVFGETTLENIHTFVLQL